MFPLFRKNISFLPFCRSSSSSSSPKLHKRFIKFQACKFLSSSSPSQAHSRSVKVSVWWDIDKCGVPSGVSYRKVAPSIMAAVRANGIKGEIEIQGYYADSSKINDEAVAALALTAIEMHRIIPGEKNAAYENILRDLQDWAYKNPPPAHLFLIFGDVHFSGILHRLRMCNYNILLACPGRAHVALYHAATIMWQWSSLLKGEDLTGRHFNYPPDGPFNSRYGNSNVPLENPFSAAAEQPISLQYAEIYKPSLDIKLGETSKSFSKQVMKMLSSHPYGISIGDLRAKLTKCDRPLSKHSYGYQKISEFLVSIPHVQLQYLGKGNFWVCLVPSTTSAAKNKQKDRTATQKMHNEGKNMDRSVDGIPKISSSYVSSEGDDSKSFQSMPSQGKPIGDYADGKSSFLPFKESNVHQPSVELQKTSLGSEKVVDVARALLPQIQLPMHNNNISIKSDNDIAESKHENPTKKEVDEVCRNPFTSTFFSWISSRWTFWKSNGKPDDLTAYQVCPHWQEPKSLEEWQQHASDWENMRVSVWWDFNSCGVPSDISFLNVAPSIMGVLRANKIKGSIHIDAYGDVSQLSENKQEALYLSGINLHHIPGGKNVSHKRLMDWASQNPPPAHLFLIYDDRDHDFDSTMRLLDDRDYNILCAHPIKGRFSVATIVWQWSSMLKGKYLTGKYHDRPPHWYIKGQVPLEYPPEWYRNSNVPLENPLSAVEKPTSSQNAEIHEPSSYINLVEVPKSLSRKVRKILSLYPNGISIGDLRLQLEFIYRSLDMFSFWDKTCNSKEFPNILVSIPHVQLLYIGEGDFCVCLIPSMTSVVMNEQRIASFSRSRSREDVAHKL